MLLCSELQERGGEERSLVRVYQDPEGLAPQYRKGQPTDSLHRGVLEIKVIVCRKCQSSFAYISGVFNDSGDLKSVCEAE